MTGLSQLLLGWSKPGRRSNSKPVHDDGEGHLVTIAPTGGGKGVSALIPALLSWQGPAIVIDPKGEAFNVTARRRLDLGQEVFLLDPFGVTDADADSLNPLDLIEPGSPTAADDAAMLSYLLSSGAEHRQDPFWDDRARAVITAALIDVMHENIADCAPTLGAVRQLIAGLGGRGIASVRWLGSPRAEVQAAAAALHYDPRVLSSILATAQTHTSFLRSGPVQDALASSTIRLADITAGTPMTLYLVLPPDKLVSHGRLLRLWLGVVLAALSRRREIPPVPTLLLVDEAAQLGTLEPLLTAVTLLRGYGVKVWSFWQDLAQLKTLYPQSWTTLLNNCQSQQIFAPASPHAAADLEEYLAGASPVALSSLGPDDVLVTRKGERPRVLRRADYRHDPQYAGQFDANPFYRHRAQPATAPETRSGNVLAFPEQRPHPEPRCRL